MGDDISVKIRVFAKVLGIVLVVSGIIAWLYFITNSYTYRGNKQYITADDIFGWISLVSGFLGYVSTWLIEGFAQLIEDTGKIREVMEAKETASSPAKAPVASGSWICNRCQTENSSSVAQCKKCGNYR